LLETYPTWAPDGRHLYFCTAPIPWEDRKTTPPKGYEGLKYSLVRVPFDPETGRWGERETVLSAEETGSSILLPRLSPDGRYLLFAMCDYGCFPIYQPSSDLYLLDLDSRVWRRLEVNSEQSEAWHTWSSNGRWIVFSSKRFGGVFTRLLISHVDPAGRASKPFLLPRQDPASHDSILWTHSMPELVTGPVPVGHRELTRAARAPDRIEVADVVTSATPSVPPTTPGPAVGR